MHAGATRATIERTRSEPLRNARISAPVGSGAVAALVAIRRCACSGGHCQKKSQPSRGERGSRSNPSTCDGLRCTFLYLESARHHLGITRIAERIKHALRLHLLGVDPLWRARVQCAPPGPAAVGCRRSSCGQTPITDAGCRKGAGRRIWSCERVSVPGTCHPRECFEHCGPPCHRRQSQARRAVCKPACTAPRRWCGWCDRSYRPARAGRVQWACQRLRDRDAFAQPPALGRHWVAARR